MRKLKIHLKVDFFVLDSIFLYLCFMDKELFKTIVLHLTKCEEKTKKVLKIVYGPETKRSKIKKEEPTCSSDKRTKKDELMESLLFLKSKKNKTKKDFESIGILESVLKNM